MVRRAILVCLLAAGLALPFLARAEHTRFWRESDYSEFEKGTAEGVALRSDGKLIAAPRFTEFSDPNLPYLWELRLDSRGRLFAAGGSDAKVVRFDGPGKASTVFESPELAAQALALDSHDNLYVGTSPDGKIYKVTPEGKQSVFFEPNTKYIWSLAVDADGTLYVGTGDKGEVFVVAQDGKGRLFYKSDERHARSLAFDSSGSLLIGTDPDGLIVRVKTLRKKGNPLPEAGPAFVVYETDKKEVTSLLTDASGNLYASAVGDKARSSAPNPAAVTFTVESAPGAPTVPQMALATAQPQQPAATMQVPMQFPFPSLTGGSEVYRIAPDGSPQSLWKSHQDLVYALAFSASGKLLLGTGNRGQVIELEGNNVFSVLAKSASSQITSFAAARDGSVFLATANPGKVFTLASGYATGGTFESSTFDAKIFSQWGRLTWWGEDGAASGKVSFYVRSGNTSDSQRNWSPWAGPYSKTAGEVVNCPPARFVQWKAVFSNVPAAESPSISWVSLAYLPKNVAPVIDSIVIQDPGIRVQGFAAPVPVPGGAASVPLRMPKTQSSTPSVSVPPPEFGQRSKTTEPPPQGFEQKGYQSVLWSAHDDNDDDLAFALYYRGEGEKNWKLLKDKIHQDFYSWDTSAMPDGAYYLKLVASDAPSNPSEETLTTEQASERLVVDNTPPTIENLRAEVGNPQVRVHFTARDPSSAIENTEYSFDAGDWETVFPVGRVTGSLEEDYVVVMRNLAPGEHTMAVRVSDRFRNTSSAKVTFTVPPGRSH